MNTYDQKQAARRDRLTAAAMHAHTEAEAARARSNAMANIMNGTPVLIGHHSERRHRRDIDKMRRLATKQYEALDHAADLERRAAAVGTAGVSSDDPDAVSKLISKTEDLEARHNAMKTANKIFDAARKAAAKAGKDDLHARGAGWQALVEAGYFSAEEAAYEARLLASCGHDRPFPPYKLTNIGARIRDAKARANQLETRAVRAAEAPISGAVEDLRFEITDSVEVNRVQIWFSDKPSTALRSVLKREGFRWAPSEGVWQRQAMSGAAWYAAKRALGLPLTDPVGMP